MLLLLKNITYYVRYNQNSTRRFRKSVGSLLLPAPSKPLHPRVNEQRIRWRSPQPMTRSFGRPGRCRPTISQWSHTRTVPSRRCRRFAHRKRQEVRKTGECLQKLRAVSWKNSAHRTSRAVETRYGYALKRNRSACPCKRRGVLIRAKPPRPRPRKRGDAIMNHDSLTCAPFNGTEGVRAKRSSGTAGWVVR